MPENRPGAIWEQGPRSGGIDVDADFEGSLDVDPELDFLRRGERESAVVEEGAKLRLASENRARLKSDKEDEVGHASSDGRDNKRGQSTARGYKVDQIFGRASDTEHELSGMFAQTAGEIE
ncbi:MAG: hypothetical protein SFV15_11160 [Polyangiaceae bacterium]|nr:hypothetical protein [Polyangiaceae bacterium]